MHLPAYRFGKPYESLERDTLVHFLTGEKIAEVSQVGGAIVGRDLQKAGQARAALSTSRKFIVPALEFLDSRGDTVRRGDSRQVVTQRKRFGTPPIPH